MTRDEALKILGPGDLEKAYRRAAKSAHPDCGGSEEAFIKAQRAYDLLRKPPETTISFTWMHTWINEANEQLRSGMTETQFKSNLVGHLRGLGAKTFKIHGSEWQESGWPDLYVAHKRWTGWLELKVTAREEELQKKCIKDLKIRGVHAAFCRRKVDHLHIYDFCGVDETVRFPLVDLLASLNEIFTRP